MKSNQLPNLKIDQEQALVQLQILGYNRGDVVYPRVIVPDGDPRKSTNAQARNLKGLKWSEVERFNQDGYGIYIVVNGSGHKDEDITHCRAIFCEFDDRPIEDQINFWRDLGLPEPSLQIATRKSVHTYWVFDSPIPVEDWRQLQTALLTYTDSDKSLKNPSRVMRLAGAYHIKPGSDPIQCQIIHQSSNRYSYEELRSALPVVQPEAVSVSQLSLVPQPEPGAAPQHQRYEDISVPVPETVPLEVCLSKESRSLLNSGISEGGRNNGGAKLARDLIGTANYLQSIGQQSSGNPRLLLDEYASRCSPPLSVKEVEAIWKSAEKDRPGPSCKPEGVDSCLKGWYWNTYVKPNQQNHHQQSGQGFGDGREANRLWHRYRSNGGGTPPIAAVSLVDRIRDILSRHDSESLQASALMDLASATGRTSNEIRQLARIIRSEGDLAAEVVDTLKSFRGLLSSCRKRLDINRFLESDLAVPLQAKAAAMPTAVEYLFNTLLSASASRIGTGSRVIVNPEGGYKQPCIFWTANVAHSGQAKTPPQQEIVSPLEEMEADAKELYDLELSDYEQDEDSTAKAPVRQRRLLNNVTSSTKIRIHDENPRGLLEYIDELVADYQRLNQYKSGKGDDLQLELSFWNGAGCNYDRQDVRLFLKRTAFSKTGTYQWDTLARLMADEVNFTSSGYAARFLYCSVLDAPPRYLDLLSHQHDSTLNDKLTWLYSELEQLPENDFFLSHEAKVLFQAWNHTLVNAEIEESHFGLSLVYPKIEANTARLALWLHIVNAVLRGEKPAPTISGTTMQHAIEIGSFYLWQHKLIHAHNSPTRKLEGIFLKVQTLAEKVFTKSGVGIGASFAKSRLNNLKSWVVGKIRSGVFSVLANAGFGQLEGEGGEMTYIPSTVPGNIPPDPVGDFGGVGGELVVAPIAESKVESQIQASIGEVGGNLTPIQTHVETEQSPEPEKVVEVQRGCLLGETSPSNTPYQFTNFTNSDDATIDPSTLQTVDDHQLCHQLEVETPIQVGENVIQQPVEQSDSSRQIGESTPTASDLGALILQCRTWVEIVEAVEQDSQKFIQATKEIAKEQRQSLVPLLAAHLCQNPTALSQLAWVPSKLRERALELLSFTIGRIGGTGIFDACVEKISGYKFVSVQQIGTRHEHWVFRCPLSGQNIPVFDIEAIEAIALG